MDNKSPATFLTLFIEKIKRITFRRIRNFSLYFITGLLCLLVFLLSTPVGSQFTLYVVDKFSPVTVEYNEGIILDDLLLSHFSFDNDQLAINVRDARIKFHLRCLWKEQLCIDELSAESIKVSLKATTENRDADTVKSDKALPNVDQQALEHALVQLPFGLEITKVALGRIEFTNDTLNVVVKDFSSAVTFEEHHLTIKQTAIGSSQIRLLVANKPEPVSQNGWPLTSLPTIFLPINLTTELFTLDELTIFDDNLLVEPTDDSSNEPVTAQPRGKSPILTFEKIRTRLSWFKTNLTLIQFSTDINPMGSVSLKGAVDFIHPYPLSVELKTRVDELNLWPHINDSTQALTLGGDLSALLINLESEGALVLKSQAHIDLTKETLPYDIELNATKFTLPTDITEHVQPSSLKGTSKGNLNSHEFNVAGNVSGYGYKNTGLKLTGLYDSNLLTVKTFNFLDSEGDNQLDLAGNLTIGDKISWAVKVNSTGMTLPLMSTFTAKNADKSQPIDTSNDVTGRLVVALDSKGYWQKDKWAVEVKNSTIEGVVNDMPIQIMADVHINDKAELAPSTLKINYNNTLLDLSGYSDDAWHVNGQLVIQELDTWLSEVDGTIDLALGISGKHTNPQFNVKGFITDLNSFDVTSTSIDVELLYQPLNNHNHNISITSEMIDWKDHDFVKLSNTLIGDLNNQKLSLHWQGDSAADVQIDNSYNEEHQQFDVDINQAVFSYQDYVLQPDKTINLSYKNTDNSVSINQHCWQSTHFKTCVAKDRVLKDQDKLTVNVNLDAQILKPFLPQLVNIDTQVSGGLTVDWLSGEFDGVNAELIADAGTIKMNDNDEWIDLTQWNNGLLNFTLVDSMINTKLKLIDNNDKSLFDINAEYSMVENTLVEGLVAINQFSIKTLQPFIPSLTLLEGELSSNVTLTGKLEDLMLNGEVTLGNGIVNVRGVPQSFDDINLSAQLNGKNAIVKGEIIADEESATLDGLLDWTNEPMFDLNLASSSFKLSLSPEVDATVAPNINAKLEGSLLKISGEIEVLAGKLTLGDLPEGSVSLSNDVVIVNDKGEKVVKESTIELETDLRIKIDDSFAVLGHGFEGKLGGELHVTQKAKQPMQMFGSLNIPEGEYKAYGQRLSVDRGSIAFNGPISNPYIMIRAVRNISEEDIIVGIEAVGLANSLKINLFSNPAMQESETLSYLVRGKGTDAETGNTGAAIGVALATGLTSITGITSEIEKLPWISQIEIEGDADQASIAGYVGERLYFKYGVGIADPVNEITVRFYILSRLWVETVSGLEESADIYYSFDIE